MSYRNVQVIPFPTLHPAPATLASPYNRSICGCQGACGCGLQGLGFTLPAVPGVSSGVVTLAAVAVGGWLAYKLLAPDPKKRKASELKRARAKYQGRSRKLAAEYSADQAVIRARYA